MPIAPERKPARLAGVQALRGVAATAVVLCHAARHVNKVFGAPLLIGIFQAGHAGVDLFFVISGFIILFVHRRDIGRRQMLPHYLGRRFNRVMPLYWIALTITVAMGAAASNGLPPAGRIIWSATLLPSMTEPLLGIAWTLQYEIVFYAMFALLIVSRSAGVVAFGLWFMVIGFSLLGQGQGVLAPSLCGAYGFEFFMGMAAAFLVSTRRLPSARLIAALGLGMFTAALLLESNGLLNGFGVIARLIYGSAALLLVAGLAAAEESGQVSVPAWLKALGEASYSIYLFQFVFIGIAWQVWQKAGFAQNRTSALCFIVLAASGVAGGLLASRLIEHPLLRLTRGNARLRSVT